MSERYVRLRRRASVLANKARDIQTSRSYVRVVGVLSGLGFLIAPDVPALSRAKVELDEAIQIGRSIEPRVLEVLPAAVVSFPSSFLHLERTPQPFKEVINALKTGRTGPEFEGIPFQKLFEAANRPTKNRTRKIITERRIPKTFRFSRETIRAIEERAGEQGIDYTSYLEKLVAMDSSCRVLPAPGGAA